MAAESVSFTRLSMGTFKRLRSGESLISVTYNQELCFGA